MKYAFPGRVIRKSIKRIFAKMKTGRAGSDFAFMLIFTTFFKLEPTALHVFVERLNSQNLFHRFFLL
jgi:hypothetical protein